MNIDTSRTLVATTPMLKGVESVEHLDEGYSTDEKFILWADGVPTYLLRLSQIEDRSRRRRDFDLILKHRERGVLCPDPYLFGVTADGARCYSVMSYLPGQNAEKSLPKMSEEQQYEIGVTAGGELPRIHELVCPDRDFDWPAYRRAKYRRRVEQAGEMGLSFIRQSQVERFVGEHQGLLDEAPVRFQHDDFHPANLIVNEGLFVETVDFNRSEWGDPIEDFYKVPWFTVQISPPFARGQLEGYLSGGVPSNFWMRYNLYVAMSLFGALVWPALYYPEQLSSWQHMVEEIIDSHDLADGGPPAWAR